MIKVKEIKEAEELLKNALNELRGDIKEAVETSQPIPGVNVIGDRTAIVSFSTLAKSNNWAPSTYIPQSQIEAVECSLKNLNSLDDFVKKLTELVKNKSVKQKNNTICLNENTIKALSNVLDMLL